MLPVVSGVSRECRTRPLQSKPKVGPAHGKRTARDGGPVVIRPGLEETAGERRRGKHGRESTGVFKIFAGHQAGPCPKIHRRDALQSYHQVEVTVADLPGEMELVTVACGTQACAEDVEPAASRDNGTRR